MFRRIFIHYGELIFINKSFNTDMGWINGRHRAATFPINGRSALREVWVLKARIVAVSLTVRLYYWSGLWDCRLLRDFFGFVRGDRTFSLVSLLGYGHSDEPLS